MFKVDVFPQPLIFYIKTYSKILAIARNNILLKMLKLNIRHIYSSRGALRCLNTDLNRRKLHFPALSFNFWQRAGKNRNFKPTGAKDSQMIFLYTNYPLLIIFLILIRNKYF